VGGQHHAPADLPPGKTRYPLYRKLGGPQGRSGRVRKISPQPGFDSGIYMDREKKTVKTLNRRVNNKTDFQIEKIHIEFVEEIFT
jgi:hypothetical protein